VTSDGAGAQEIVRYVPVTAGTSRRFRATRAQDVDDGVDDR
jgi:hypothetical protein